MPDAALTLEWSAAPPVFMLGGRTMTGRDMVGPEVLAWWEDRFDDDPSLPTLIRRTDRVMHALLDPDSAVDYQAARDERANPVGIGRLSEVAEWLFEQHTCRSFIVTRRLFGWARANWNDIDGYALAHGGRIAGLSLREVLNLTYWALVDGSDEKERRRLDRQLTAPAAATGGQPMLDPGQMQLLQLVSGRV